MGVAFRATIDLVGTTATGIRVPPAIVAELGEKKRPPVVVTIGDHSYRFTVAVYGDQFFLPLNRGNRIAADCEAGDEI